ncbi:MAG: Ig-like domain-containing protein [Candidatus Thermoplasmatota archaeon]|jgi:hypothetical protein|nr:Ig-like domain-containing protein [Candidatus Thermoplasmatota archaeon]
MQKARWGYLISVIILVVSLAIIVPTKTGAEQTSYPTNSLLHDYEPSADEQWDMDTAINGNGNLFAVWADARLLDADIRFTKSLDGSSWGDGVPNNDKIVNDDSEVGYDHLDPSIAVDQKGRVYVVWLDLREPQAHLRISTSNNSGGIWTTGRKVDEVTGAVSSPVLRWSSTAGLCLVYMEARDQGGNVHTDIMFTRSLDEGLTFSEPVVVNDDNNAADQMNPRMAVAGDGTVGIVWEDARNDDGTGSNLDVQMTMTKDGTSFRPNQLVGSDGGLDRQSNPDIAFSSRNDCIIVFQEYGLNGWRIRYSMGWSGSVRWDGRMPTDHQATVENLTRVEQYSPRVSWGSGSFAVAWTEKDLRDFVLVRAGYLSRDGETVSGEHIVDNTISLGKFVKDPQIYIAQMHKDTVSVLCFGDRTHVFWLDCRTDPVPTNSIAEDLDPYTAMAFPAQGMPLAPSPVTMRARNISWGSFILEWSTPIDMGWKYLYVKLGKGATEEPNEFQNDFMTSDRLGGSASFDGLDPDTIYQVRLMVKDEMGRKAYSQPIQFRTLINMPPLFIFNEPDGTDDSSDQGMFIRWTAGDDEDIAHFELHYDDDLDPSDQIFLLRGNTTINKGEGELFFNTSSLSPGGYTINATIDDHVNPPVTIYSPAIIVQHRSVLIDHPSVLSCIIEGGRESAYLDPVIRVVFTKEMTPTTLDQETVYVIDGQSFLRREGSLTVISTSALEWRPRSALPLGSKFTFIITPQALDSEGNKLDGQNIGGPSSFSFQFLTRSDAGVPEVRSYAPQGKGVKMRPIIRVTFDLPLDPSTVSGNTVSLIGPTGIKVPLNVSYEIDGPSIIATCNHPLRSNNSYSIQISHGITSLKGVELASDLNWTFTTGAPDMSIDTDDDDVPDDLDMFPYDPTEGEDTDLDGIGDNKDLDDDGDGMPDVWESRYALDPRNPKDAEGDLDSDGRSNLQEYRDGTSPDRTPEEEKAATWLFIIVALFVLVVIGILLFALVQRNRMETRRLQEEFFKEE